MQRVDAALSKRNYWLMIIEGALFWLGWAVLDANTVISVFMMETTGSLAMAGLASTLRNCAFIISQTVLGFFMYAVNDRARVMHIVGYISRPVLLVMIPALLLGMWGMPAALVFLGAYAVYFIADGVAGLLWTEIMASTVVPNLRGRINGYQQVLGGLCGLLSSVAVRFIFTSALTQQQQFAILFGANGVIMLINSLVLGRIGDAAPENRPPKKEIRPREYIAGLIALFKESSMFRKVVGGRFCHNAAVLVVPMFILFGKQACGLTEGQAASLITLSVLGQIGGGFLWGHISHRVSYKAVMRYSSPINIIIMGLGIGCHLAAGQFPLYIPLCAMVFLGMVNNCAWLGYTHHLIDNVDAANRPHYLVLQGVALFPSMFFTFGAGVLATAVHFGAVFAVCFAFAVMGTYIVYRHLR